MKRGQDQYSRCPDFAPMCPRIVADVIKRHKTKNPQSHRRTAGFLDVLELQKHQFGTEGRNRTGTPLQARDFESRASTSSATPAYEFVLQQVQQHEVVAPFETFYKSEIW